MKSALERIRQLERQLAALQKSTKEVVTQARTLLQQTDGISQPAPASQDTSKPTTTK